MKVQRRASVMVCDEILFGLTGKVYLQGVYTADITIPGGELHVNQLIFYFTAETSKEKPFKKITLKVVAPEMPPAQFELPTVEVLPQIANDARPKMIMRAPLLMQQLVLKPGKIETTVITESEELDAGGIWVVSVPKFPS
jgi:hypothetical protein